MIDNLESLREFIIDKVKTPIFGVGVYAFDRLGPEEIIPNYRLITLRYSKDTKFIEEDIGVFSLERGMGTKHINAPRNSTTVVTHPKTHEYLKKYKNPALVVYKSSIKMERVCKKNSWTLVAPPKHFGKSLFEDKVKFRKILKEIKVTVPPGEILPAESLNFYKAKRKYGLPFVLQHPRRGGGKGTFFIHHEDDWHHALKKLRVREEEGIEIAEDISGLYVILAKYIRGSSPSITGCVTRHGILSTSPQYQLIDIPQLYNPDKGSGLFCGHDWSASRFEESTKQQMYRAVERVGKYFKAKGYKGIFGLDFVLDEKKQKVYVVEANPRLLGSFPTLTMVQLANNEPPIIAFHLLEYLGIDYELDLAKINTLMRKPKRGAQMFSHNLTGHWAKSNGAVRAGVYRLQKQKGKLKFVRPGYAIKHLKNKDEFLLTDGVLQKKAHYSPNRRLGRIITLRRVLKKDKKRLTPWAKRASLLVHDSFKLKRVRFVKIVKFFNPNYLAKG